VDGVAASELSVTTLPLRETLAFASANDGNAGSDRRIVLGVRGPGLGEIADGAIDDQIYNVFTIDQAKITRIEDYRDRDQALAAVGNR
jgi:hypothetical protein